MISRRLFLALPLAPSLRSLAGGLPTDAHHFQYDHVLGTSLDLTVWSTTVEEAVRVERAVLDEVGRLSMMLDTRDPRSEISRIGQRAVRPSSDVADVFALYAEWHVRTGGVLSLRSAGPDASMDVDALGKAFIVDRAATAGRRAGPGIEGLLLNVGGDIVTWGRNCEVGVADPDMPYDNVPPVSLVRLRDAAVATSGPSARGAHLIDARTGRPPRSPASATVIAGDLVTANALATTLCVVEADAGLALVERTPGAHAVRVGADGAERRSSGFPRLERQQAALTPGSPSLWPSGFQLAISFTLPNLGVRSLRPFLAAWVEDEAGTLVRIITVWGRRAEWYKELTTFWRLAAGSQALLQPVTRPTRSPGRYRLVWDGRDTSGEPAPQGRYRIVIEVNRERGEYSRKAVTVACAGEPVTERVEPTVNWDDLTVQYGPKAG